MFHLSFVGNKSQEVQRRIQVGVDKGGGIDGRQKNIKEIERESSGVMAGLTFTF